MKTTDSKNENHEEEKSKALTKRLIDATKYEGSEKKEGQWTRDVRWDSDPKGFGLRIYPSGAKVFILRYTSQGRKTQMTLGAYGQGGGLTLPRARDMAKEYLYLVNREKRNPLAEKKKESHADTVRDLCKDYLELHAKQKKKSWREDERKIKNYIIPEWGTLKAVAVTHRDVVTLHVKIGKKSKYEANRTQALLSKIFEKAKDWGVIDAMMPNPARGIEHFPERKRSRFLTFEEYSAFRKAVNEESNPYVKAAFDLLLLTGLRKSELLRAKRSDIDFARHVLYLPETKSGEPQYVSLNTKAMEIIEKLPSEAANPYLLPGGKQGQPLVNLTKPWSRIRKAAGCPDLRIHDLRRTFGSWLAMSGHSLNLIGKALRHADLKTTQVYAHLAESNVRDAVESHGSKILELESASTKDG